MNFKEAVSSKWDRVSRNWKFKSTFRDEKSNIKIISLNKPGGDKWSVRNCQQEINDNIYLVWLPKGFYFVLLISCSWSKIEWLKSLPVLEKLYFMKKRYWRSLKLCSCSSKMCLKSPKNRLTSSVSSRFLFNPYFLSSSVFRRCVHFIQFPRHKRS